MTDTAITTVARHHVPADKEAEFSDWASDIDAASRRFPGYLGMDVIHSHGESDLESYCMFKFDNEENLDAWMKSDQRRKWLEDERSCSSLTANVRSFRSLGFWFASPEMLVKMPSNHKMALVTFFVIWPLVHFIPEATSAYVQTPWLAEFLSVGVIVALVTYVVMPQVTRLLSKWLYK
jgi:antibiotic biosynthesis monooxygenase (ABM) superfamily enzyme